MSNKHTIGPWISREGSNPLDDDIFGTNDQPIATVFTRRASDTNSVPALRGRRSTDSNLEGLANSRLIVSAPSMLLALQRIAMTKQDDIDSGRVTAADLVLIARSSVTEASDENRAPKCLLGLLSVLQCENCGKYEVMSEPTPRFAPIIKDPDAT